MARPFAAEMGLAGGRTLAVKPDPALLVIIGCAWWSGIPNGFRAPYGDGSIARFESVIRCRAPGAWISLAELVRRVKIGR